MAIDPTFNAFSRPFPFGVLRLIGIRDDRLSGGRCLGRVVQVRNGDFEILRRDKKRPARLRTQHDRLARCQFFAEAIIAGQPFQTCAQGASQPNDDGKRRRRVIGVLDAQQHRGVHLRGARDFAATQSETFENELEPSPERGRHGVPYATTSASNLN